AVEATSVAVSNARTSTAEDAFQQGFLGSLEVDHPTRLSVGEPCPHPHRRELVAGRLGPFHEDDGAVEVRLQVAPLRRRDALEPEEIEVRDGDAALVAVPDRVRRARYRPLDAEAQARAAHERRLAGAELAGDRDDVAGA